jgi:nucleoid DNA-binding protein
VHKSQLIDHVISTAMIDSAHDAMIATVKGNTVSLLGHRSCIPVPRAARQGHNPRNGATVRTAASEGVRPTPGSSCTAAHNAKSGARKAASAKAAKGPAHPAESVRLR